ncbi:phospholipase A1 member A-like [Leguminivora glycinivorella]|uniref:phospholipase A1 member A-like n=1 Tax=Leguminivora glycinivorella TaxID=1035111 RepID=UPI00200D1E04|nr:phospholipase A1 member A-like [Leguminivora glycinivorella]
MMSGHLVKINLSYEVLRTYFVVFMILSVAAVEFSREAEGHPVGLLPDCPNSDKPAAIKPKSLKKLFVTVMNKEYRLTKSYDYYHIRSLAKNQDVDFSKKTLLYCGGYLDSNSWPFGRVLGELYKDLGYNVLLLDTLEFTARLYPQATRVIRPIGKHVAEMLVKLRAHGLDPKKLELVGLSLGAHTMSFIAKNYRLLTGQNISSLTALDAAGPCFRQAPSNQRLDPSDADFVLAIVTNMDGFGIELPVGHVIFYANGGEYQPGDIPWLPCDVFCSHIRGYILWLSALFNPGTFIGVRCDTIQQVRDGECYHIKPMVTNTLDLYTDRSKPGMYYLRTTNVYPYALGKKGLKKPKPGEFRISKSLLGDIFLVK